MNQFKPDILPPAFRLPPAVVPPQASALYPRSAVWRGAIAYARTMADHCERVQPGRLGNDRKTFLRLWAGSYVNLYQATWPSQAGKG